MSSLMFIACADIHLSDVPPRCRAEEPDWHDCQMQVLQNVSEIANNHSVKHVLFAGDFFDRARVSQKLEAMVIETLRLPEAPTWYVIPGQHDLPGHSMKLLEESSLGVMLAAEVLHPLWNLDAIEMGEKTVTIEAHPFGMNVEPSDADILITHRLLWHKEKPFPDAPEEGNAIPFLDKVPNRLVISGDNHKPFDVKADGKTIINCGSMMRRNIREEEYVPSVVLIYDDWSFQRIPLDISQNVFTIPESVKKQDPEKEEELRSFIEMLSKETVDSLTFDSALKRVCSKREVSKIVQNRIQMIREDLKL